ncbi:hypothetical protein FKM82_004073 [Ascaphus truei]
MVSKDMIALNILLCAISCFSSAWTIDDVLNVIVEHEFDNGNLETEEAPCTVSECQTRETTKWDKLFTILENSQMKENMLLQSIDEVIKVELQSVRAEMLQFVDNFAGTCGLGSEGVTPKNAAELDTALPSRLNQDEQYENSLEASNGNIVGELFILSNNISNRLDKIENAQQRKDDEADAGEQNQVDAKCKIEGNSLNSALRELDQVSSKLQLTEKWISQRILPSGCEVAILFPMRSPKIYASVHPADMTLPAFTACVWVKVTEALDKTVVFSYGTKRNAYEIQLYLDRQDAVLVVGGDKNKVTARHVTTPGQWSHLCGTWSSVDGTATIWANGEISATSFEVAKGHVIPPRGILQLGQEKNGCCVGGGFDESLSFSGKVTGFNVWDRVLSEEEIVTKTGAEDACGIRGNIVGWGTTEILPHGGAQYIH